MAKHKFNYDRTPPEGFIKCHTDKDRIAWLFDRLMALEEALYTAQNFSKFKNGKAERPKGWELTEQESDGNE